MINWKIKDFNSPPEELYIDSRLKAQYEAERLKDGDQIKGNHYNFPSLTNNLRAFSIGKTEFNEETDSAKCYYCESAPEVVASLQVEHYRPKQIIHDDNRQVVPGTNGYYWLGLEWSNLVLACPKCNGRSAKGNIFTISGFRVASGKCFNDDGEFSRDRWVADKSPLLDELPDLLHPEIDDAYNFLSFNFDGKINYKLPRGERTIKICKLDRKALNIARNKLINKFLTEFFEVIGWYEVGEIQENQIKGIFTHKCRKLRSNFRRELPYTLLSRYLIEDFETFYALRIPIEYREKLREAFAQSAHPA